MIKKLRDSIRALELMAKKEAIELDELYVNTSQAKEQYDNAVYIRNLLIRETEQVEALLRSVMQGDDKLELREWQQIREYLEEKLSVLKQREMLVKESEENYNHARNKLIEKSRRTKKIEKLHGTKTKKINYQLEVKEYAAVDDLVSQRRR